MASQEVQLHAVKSLGGLYDEDDVESLADEIKAARADALRAVVQLMTTFADNMLLCQHCCFAVSVLIVPGVDVGLDDPALLKLCLDSLLRIVRGDDGYPQKEACRAIIALVPALMRVPNAVAALRDATGVREALESSVRQRVQWAPWERRNARDSGDGVDCTEHEEGLALALTALGLVVGVDPVVATLEKGVEAGKPSVGLAASTAIVELARLGAGQALCNHEQTLTSTFRRCFASQWDMEVTRALELASGFCIAAAQSAQHA
jgi:hypothetical protein